MGEQIKITHKSIFEIRFPDGTNQTLSEEQANQLYDSLGTFVGQRPMPKPTSEVSEEKPVTVIGAAQKRRKAITRLLPEVPF